MRVRWKTAWRVLAVTIDGHSGYLVSAGCPMPADETFSTPDIQFQAIVIPLTLALVGGELLHVLRGQHRGVMPAARGVDLEEGAELQPRPPHVVERAGAARTAR